MRNMKRILRFVFLILFISISYYIMFIESERYESESIVLLRDLSKKQEMDLSTVLLGQSSSNMQDSMVLELYMRSFEMFSYINKKYDLVDYYTSSDKLDFLQRLYKNTIFPFYKASQQNILEKYNADLHVVYDDPSATLQLSFIHTDPFIAKEILNSIIKRSEEIINGFAKENAKIALRFIEKLREEKRKLFVEAIKKLIDYQNSHHTIDPSLDVERKITILTDLETELVKNEVEYATKLKTFNPNSREVKMLKENIRNIRTSISRVKKQLSGANNGKELNANVFEFELLKSDMEFAKEVYRQTLINQEEVSIEVSQQSKHFIVVAKPTLPDYYRYPNKLWDILTLAVVLFVVYSIIMSTIMIIISHKD